MTVRAKMYCAKKTLYTAAPYEVSQYGADGKVRIWPREFVFNAVTSSDENKIWSQSTPTASVTITVANPEVDFAPGAEYYVDFTKVNDDAGKEPADGTA